jgi:hypothetical protein
MVLAQLKITVFSTWLATVLSFSVFASDVEVISVTGKGFSVDRAEAVSMALTEAVGKVNPTAISAMNKLLSDTTKTKTTTDGQTSRDSLRIKELKSSFSAATKGVIKNWDIVSESLASDRVYEVIVSADVIRLKESKQMSRKRISVVSSLEADQELNEILKSAIEEGLTKSRKFAVLQDNSSAEIRRFISNIKTNGRMEDLVRVQGPAAPEIIAVVGLGRLTDTGTRLRGRVSVEVINYASGQIKYQNSIPVLLKKGDLASAHRRLVALGSELSKQLIANIYPPLVVGWNGTSMTLGLGDGFFAEGDVVRVHESLGGLKDRYTGEFLEENLRPLCEAVITTVTSRISLAKPRGDCGSPFTSHSLDELAELEARMFVVTRISYDSFQSGSGLSTSKSKSNKNSDFDGLFKTD